MIPPALHPEVSFQLRGAPSGCQNPRASRRRRGKGRKPFLGLKSSTLGAKPTPPHQTTALAVWL